jgi:hypothetical protein
LKFLSSGFCLEIAIRPRPDHTLTWRSKVTLVFKEPRGRTPASTPPPGGGAARWTLAHVRGASGRGIIWTSAWGSTTRTRKHPRARETGPKWRSGGHLGAESTRDRRPSPASRPSSWGVEGPRPARRASGVALSGWDSRPGRGAGASARGVTIVPDRMPRHIRPCSCTACSGYGCAAPAR